MGVRQKARLAPVLGSLQNSIPVTVLAIDLVFQNGFEG